MSKVKSIRTIIVSALLVSVMMVASVFVVGAVNASNSGIKTGGSSFISWTFYTEGSGNTMTSWRYTRLIPSTGVIVTDLSRRGFDAFEAYGYVRATRGNEIWITNKYLAWHKIHNNAITVYVGNA